MERGSESYILSCRIVYERGLELSRPHQQGQRGETGHQPALERERQRGRGWERGIASEREDEREGGGEGESVTCHP